MIKSRVDPAVAPLEESVEHRYIVPGLKRGLAILQLFDETKVLRLAEIARRLGIRRSSAFRLVYTLENLGFIERTRDGYGFHLASRVLTLGFSYLSSVEIVTLARDPLSALNQRTGLSVHLAVLDHREIVHLLRFQSQRAFTSNVNVGQRRPAHSTPMGRVLLSELSREQLNVLYQDESALVPATVDTPTSLDALLAILEQDKQRGFVVSYGTYVPTGCSVAAPVRDANGTIVSAINISGAREESVERHLEGSFKNELLAAAAEISRNLGYRGR